MLFRSARVEVTAEVEQALFDAYCATRRQRAPQFSRHAFAEAYAVYGAQRATKILGIFTRLATRDGKPAYLALRPRVASLLARNLAHPGLARLRHWYQAHLPEVVPS